jgi:hypothetical protein
MHLWTKLIEDPEMKVAKEILRNSEEKVWNPMGNISILPPYEHIFTILVKKKSYNEIENLREEKNTLAQ